MSVSIPNGHLETNKVDDTTVLMTSVPVGSVAEVSIRKRNHKPAFDMHGNGRGSKDKGTDSMDYTKMLLSLSKPAAFLYERIYEGRMAEIDTNGVQHPYKKSNTSVVDSTMFTAMQKKYVTKGYKELLDKDMVVRIKRGMYLINPRLVISGDQWQCELATYTRIKDSITNGK